jgi:hypothetical protein
MGCIGVDDMRESKGLVFCSTHSRYFLRREDAGAIADENSRKVLLVQVRHRLSPLIGQRDLA